MATNAKSPPNAQIVLEKFLGLFTEATPDALPEGASPLTLNTDFQVGGVFPRPGLASAYMLSQENFCAFAVDDASGSRPWLNSTSAVGPPVGVYANVALAHGQTSNGLNTTNYNLNVSSPAAIQSITVNVTAVVSNTFFSRFFSLSASIIYRGSVLVSFSSSVGVAGPSKVYTFTATNAALGNVLTAAVVSDPSFGIKFTMKNNASQTFVTAIAGVAGPEVSVAFSVPPAINFNYIKTFEQTSGQINTLALDSNGTLWQEDAVNEPGVLEPIETNILPGSFAESATIDDREFIAFSNLQNGTDVPRTYDGMNFNRMSQVGPGTPPSASITSSGSAVKTITQNAAVALLTGSHDFLLVSDSPSDTGSFGTPSTPGNVMTLIFRSATTVPSYVTPGSNIVIAGFPTINGNRVNNDPAGVLAPKFYTVTSVGMAVTGEASYDAITFTVNFTTFYNQPTPSGCTFQATEATMTTAAQVPNLEVGSSFQLTGTGGAPPSGYDSSWTVDATPNASQLQITSTVLNNNMATYGFNLVTGSLPVVGQAVTVTLTLNGNGVFNVTNAIITAATAGTFTVALKGPNVPSAAESGGGLIFGTIFMFDAFQIIGNKSGGTVIGSGTIAAGVRKICYSFLTKDGYVTQPSPILTFTVPTGASTLSVENLLPGPPNVIARIVHLTAANGGNFYNIPVPVVVNSNGVNVTNTSTYLNDNSSTRLSLSFADAVLLGATQIDVPGNNLFETVEIGAPVGIIAYSQRLFLIGEQNKVANLLNYSFDGGIKVIQNSGTGGGGGQITYPAGWTLDPVFSGGGSSVVSPVFGFAWQIAYNGAGVSGNIGMITQPAFQDEFMVPIIEASTAYSVRVTFTSFGLSNTGNVVVDLYSPSSGKVVGTFSANQAFNTMGIYTGTLLTTVLAPVPNDLIIRVYGVNFPFAAKATIDRVEVFPTQEPNLSQQVLGSYQANFEAFDQIDGVVSAAQENQQPVNSAFTLYDTLYMVKSGSLVSTQDNKQTEPAGWPTPRTISNTVGTPSIYGVAGIVDKEAGEEWAVIAHQSGAYLFDGGQPIPISEEIRSAWNQINWAVGYTVWVKNDIVNRRILFGVPMKARDANGNFPIWLPQGTVVDTQNPATPNVVLALNYKFLVTASELAGRADVHVSAFGGKLISTDMSRKWSIWTIQAPCASIVKRNDGTSPIFLGNSLGTGKIYQLTPGQTNDDGAAFNQTWTSHGFPVSEQEQGLGLGSVRKLFNYMSDIVGGSGTLNINAFPDSMTSPYAHALLPALSLPATTGGDVEIPVNEVGNRLYLQFVANAVGSGFNLSRIMLSMQKDPYSPVRGRNN